MKGRDPTWDSIATFDDEPTWDSVATFEQPRRSNIRGASASIEAGAGFASGSPNAPAIGRNLVIDTVAGPEYAQRRAQLEADVAWAARPGRLQPYEYQREGRQRTGTAFIETESEYNIRQGQGRAAREALARETPDDPYGMNARTGGDSQWVVNIVQHYPADASPQRYPGLYRGRQALPQREVVDALIQNQGRIRDLPPDAAFAYVFGGPSARAQIDEARQGPLVAPRSREERIRRGAQGRPEGPLEENITSGDVDDVRRYIPPAELAQQRDIEHQRRIRRQEAQQRGDNIRQFLTERSGGRGAAAIESIAREYDEQRDPITVFTNSMEALGGQFVTGLSGVGENFGDLIGNEAITNAARTAAARGRRISTIANPGYAPDSLPYHMFNGVNAVGQIAVTLGIGAATRNPAAVSAFLQGAQVYGDRYDQSRSQGRSVAESMLDATAYGVFEYIPERWSMSQIMQPGGRFGSSFMGRVAKGSAVEAVQEGATEIMQIAYDQGIIGENMTWGQAWRRIKDSAIAGAIGGGSIAGAIHVGTGGHAGQQRREAVDEFAGTEFDMGGIDQAARDSFTPENGDVPAGTKPLNVTPQDEASPLPTELISEGKTVIDDVVAGRPSRPRSAGRPARAAPADINARTPFAAVRDRIIANEAGPSVGGYDALAYNTSPTQNAAGVVPPRPITRMTIGEVYDFQRGPMRARTRGRRGSGDVGSTGVGAYQFESQTLRQNAEMTFGANWRDQPFTAQNQDRIAETLWNRVRGNPQLRANTWAAFGPNARTGGTVPDVGSETGVDMPATQPEQADLSWMQPTAQPEATGEELPVTAPEARLPQPEQVDVAGRPATVEERFEVNGEPGVRLAFADGTTLEESIARLQQRGIRIGDGTRTAPINVTTGADVDSAAARAAAPTEAQKEAGNYQKGHIRLHGIDITIETPRGAERSGTDPNGQAWSVTMPDHYGYVKRTTGADAEQVDVYVGPRPESQRVFVIDQRDADSQAFDEHKAMLGYDNEADARAAYEQAFSDGRAAERIGGVTEMSADEFKGWLGSEQTTPAAEGQLQSDNVASDEIGLRAFGGGAAQAIGGNLREMLLAKLDAGDLTENGAVSPILQVASAIRQRGGDVNAETFPAIATAFTKVETTGAQRQADLRAVVDQFAPAEADSPETAQIRESADVLADLAVAAPDEFYATVEESLHEGSVAEERTDAGRAEPDDSSPAEGVTGQPSAEEPAPARAEGDAERDGSVEAQGDVAKESEAAPAEDVSADETRPADVSAETEKANTSDEATRSESADPVANAKAALQTALDALNGVTPERLEDAGEKIGGARKDRWAERGMNTTDLEGMSQGEAFQLVTKDAVWPKPDYAALVESGVAPDAAAGIKILRDSLAAKPKADSDEGRRDYIETMGIVRGLLEPVRTMADFEGIQTRLFDALGVSKDWTASRSEEQKAPRRKLFSIAKGSRFGFSIGYAERSKIAKMVREGFPAKAEPWTRRYVVREYDRSETPWQVRTKQGRVTNEERYATKVEAEAAAKAIYEGEDRSRDAQPERPHLDRIERTGEDVRNGRDVTGEDFLTDFGFRGVEYGNWVANDERQKSTNLAYEALHDLASVIGIPPRALSLGGQLALAFGARGKGRAAAHYEPGKLVINLTKLSGAGALAHEWGHAFDHYFGSLDTDLGTRGAPKGASGWYDQTSSRLVALGNLRPEMAQAFDNLMNTIFRKERTRADAVREQELRIEQVQAGIAKYREMKEKTEADPVQAKVNKKWLKSVEGWIAQQERLLLAGGERLATLKDETKPTNAGQVETSFYSRAAKLPGKHAGKPYWTLPTEMLARSFEAYVFDKIAAQEKVSQYLVQGVEEAGSFAQAAYPTGEERQAINAAYDKLFDTMDVREQDGEQMLFQRRLTEGDNPIFYSALERAVAANPTARASAEQWAATLSKAAGLKKEELEWSGLFDWLDAQTGPVTRDELLAVIRDGGIQVEEVVLSHPDGVSVGQDEIDAQADILHERRVEELIEGGLDEEAARDQANGEYGTFQEFAMNDLIEGMPASQFSDWTSDPSNESYRELLITLPVAQGGNPERAPATHWDQQAVVAHARFMDKTDADGNRVLFVEEVQSDWHQKGRDEGYETTLSAEEMARRDEALRAADEAHSASKREVEVAAEAFRPALQEVQREVRKDFGPDDPNDTRPSASQVQFDVQYNDLIYDDPRGPEDADEMLDRWRLLASTGAGYDSGARFPDQVALYWNLRKAVTAENGTELALNEARQAASRRAEGSIPNAPFKSTWPALVLKRVVRWAVDHGYDRVAWTTGAEQNERYSLEKFIDRVEITTTSGGIGRADAGPLGENASGVRFAAYDKNGHQVGGVPGYVSNASDLYGVIGKEAADKLWNAAPVESREAGMGMARRELQGLDLRSGGEGMRGFYDRNLVNIANDLIKKYGGKVGTVSFDPADTMQQVPFQGDTRGSNPGFTITPALAEAARSGLPLFQNAKGKPVSAADAAAIAERLHTELDALGISDRIALKVANGLLTDKGAQGAYFRRVIQVSLDMATNPSATLGHEAIHAMRALGLFTDSEWSALTKAAKADADIASIVRKEYARLSPEKQDEEAAAEFFSRWRDERMQAKGFAAKAFQRLLDFMGALGRAVAWIKGDRSVKAGTVMRRIESGKIGARETNAGAFETEPQFQQGDKIAFENEATEKRWQEARKGVGSGASIIEKGKAAWASVAAGMTRHWKYLPNSARFVNVREWFRKLEAAPEFAKEETVRHLNDVVGKLSSAEYDLFTRKVVLDDLDFEAGREHQLPFGLTPETLKAERARINDAVDASPKIQEAITKRLARNRKIADEMVKEEVLDAESAANPAYFRHMVLDYARAERQMARGAGSKVMSPWWAKRAGSSLDINANFLEAEADWMLKAMVDIETAKTIRKIKESEHNLRDQLRKQARDSNKQGVDEAIAKNPDLATEEAEFRKRVAMGLDDVRKAVESGDLDPPAQFREAADSLTSKSPRDESIFPFLSWIMENGKPGMRGAAMALKAISNRRAWARNLLGNRYINPENMQELVKKLAPEGYVGWQPREGRHMFTAKTIPEHIIDRLVAGLADQSAFGIGKDEMARALESIKPQLVIGGDRYTMVIPKEIGDTLDEFGDVAAESMVAKLFGGVQGAWKRWVLINPRRFLKYNLNNQIGDLDAVIAGHPATMRKVPQAARELYQVMAKGAEPSATYREAQERGVFTSGLTVQEIPDINRLSSLKHLTSDSRSNRPDKLLARGVGKVWRSLQGTTNFRESVFRYAAYLSLKEKMDAGQSMAKIGYGASVPKLIDAVTDPADRAALMARDLLGDYGAISAVGGWLRKYLIPFWSWMEINTRRYTRLFANVYRTSRAKGASRGGAAGAALTSYSAVSLSVRMAMIYGLIQLWNRLLFPDEEDDLSESQSRQLHLIIGRDSDGQVISLRTQGAFSDFLNTFGFEDAMAAFRRAEVGQGEYSDILAAAVKAPINRVATSVTPIIGEPIEQALGLELWPDAFNPRPIRDRLRHLASTFSLENEYDVVADRPSRGYWRSWTESIVYRRDPGEMAYDDIRGTAANWLERTRGESGSVNRRSPKSDALRDYRQALRFGDQDAAQEALARYRSFDGSRRGLQQSIRSAAPLGMIPRRLRSAFRAQLTPEQAENLHEAEEFYSRIYLDSN